MSAVRYVIIEKPGVNEHPEQEITGPDLNSLKSLNIISLIMKNGACFNSGIRS